MDRRFLELVVIASWKPGRRLDEGRVLAALRGGATLLQLRGKGVPAREVLEEIRAWLPACRRYDALLFVNDRVDIALAGGADGVHVGPDDLPAPTARAIAGSLVLGVSARSVERVKAAESAGADYLGVGALRGTQTKPDASVLGIQGIADLARRSRIPIVAVGGVLPGDLPLLKRAGVAGCAVQSGILDAGDPETAARNYREAWSRS